MNRLKRFPLALLVLFGCNTGPQPAQVPYPPPGQYLQQVPPQAAPGQSPQPAPQAVVQQIPQIPGQPSAPAVGVPARDTGKPPSLWMPGEPLPPTSGTGAASPEELGRAIVEAFNARNTSGVLALFPSPGNISGSLRCAGSGSPFEGMGKARQDLATELYNAWTRNEVYSLAGVGPGEPIVTMARGTERNGCLALDEIATRKHVVSLTIRSNGQVTTGQRAFVLLHIGSLNRWFLVD